MVREITAGVVGYSGYAGEELTRILNHHPLVTPHWVDMPRGEKQTHAVDGYSQKAFRSARLATSRAGQGPALPTLTLQEAINEPLNVVFLATPVEISMELVPAFLDAGTRVIDLSGAYRLGDPELFLTFYGKEHPYPDLLHTAVYGLSEVYGDRLAEARLTANPGCHATAANLALHPLCDGGLINREAGVVCDSKTGASGAGKSARAAVHFCSVSENVQLYGAMDHRHVAEILQLTSLAEEQLTFSTQLLPIRRGLMATIYFRLTEGHDPDALRQAYETAYGNKAFVDLLPESVFPTVALTNGTNSCRVGYVFAEPGRRVLVVSVLDNLVKGAAGQAVQNMNLMFSFDEAEGLL
ncbi:MAG: N-acetyl-gamma-glutamyl-phosphate reductase [Gammaproteobacteria bacterium]